MRSTRSLSPPCSLTTAAAWWDSLRISSWHSWRKVVSINGVQSVFENASETYIIALSCFLKFSLVKQWLLVLRPLLHVDATISAGTRPRNLTRALGKSSDQNSSPYQVLRPHWQDLKANNLKQHCASAYAGTCQAHIKVYRGSENRLEPENGVGRIWHGDLRKHISFLEMWCKSRSFSHR